METTTTNEKPPYEKIALLDEHLLAGLLTTQRDGTPLTDLQTATRQQLEMDLRAGIVTPITTTCGTLDLWTPELTEQVAAAIQGIFVIAFGYYLTHGENIETAA